MRFEIVLFLIAAVLMANVYTEGKVLKKLLSWKKYYQMAGIAIAAIILWRLFRKHPEHAHRIITTSNDYLKYLPVDRGTANMLSPILDFTSKQSYVPQQQFGGYNHPIMPMNQMQSTHTSEQRILNSGKKATKRSVSETKKKYVAANQNWKCGKCSRQLPAWFEVDHKIRLEHGGSNHVDNLVALCRDCHGEKTAIENL
jgi:hypothetical protein